MEVNTQRRMASLKEKIPDIQKTLDTVRFLKLKKVWMSHVTFEDEGKLIANRMPASH
jgi:hypothetical protein